MNYLILAKTEFFALINEAGNGDMETAYNGFVESVISLCYGNGNHANATIALAYAENELQHHHSLYDDSKDRKNLFVCKALSFIRKMQKHTAANPIQVPPLSNPTQTTKETPVTPALRWTGSMAELVELIYGLDAMKLVNEGETGIKELLDGFCKVFGMEIKESQCYNTYADIKRRKNDSRTYFFDKAAEKLNRRMQEDEERERIRKR